MTLRFSASRLKTWQTCPLQGHFKYDLRIPEEGNNAKAVFGSAVHAAMEHYNKTGNLPVAEAIFEDLWLNPEKLGAPVDTLVWPLRTTFSGLKSKGIEILRDVDQKISHEKRDVIGVEHKFLVPFGKYELTGVVDLLEVRTSGRGKNILRVVDLKTNSRQPNFAELYLDIQFTIYYYASLQPEFWFGNGPDFPPMPRAQERYDAYNDLPRRPIWYHLMGIREIDAGPRDDEDFMRLYRLCEMVEKAQEHKIFVPKIGDGCTFCAYHEPCGVKIPTKEEVAAQDGAWL